MHIDAICETNGKGWLIWAAQCPGAFARGATENEALAKLPGDVRRFLWHDRIHARAMWRTAAPLWGSAVADPFGFR